MQYQADLLGIPVRASESARNHRSGSRLSRGPATGVWKGVRNREQWKIAKRFEPKMNAGKREKNE